MVAPRADRARAGRMGSVVRLGGGCGNGEQQRRTRYIGMLPVGPGHPLRRLFAGLVEQVFNVDIGICDPGLTDYLGELLTDFVHVDRIFALRTVTDEVIREVSRMEAEANLGGDMDDTHRRRLINKYIGDFTLFWAGVYPENLRPRRQGGVSRLDAYLVQGKRSYGIASELTGAHEQPPAEVLQRLSRQFEFCVHGLSLVRASWDRLRNADDDHN
jgi:hypothetical protein